MIKTIIFDLDGVLVDTKKVHYEALNKALKKIENFELTISEHSKIYDGLPTQKKLEILLKNKKILKINLKKIAQSKNYYTDILLEEKIKYSKKIWYLFKRLSKNYKICIATNAIRKTLEICIKKLRIKKFINYSLSNEDVRISKPHPEIYLKCLVQLNSIPKETLILEDSNYGRVAALDSGCNLFPIKSPKNVSYKNIINFINSISEKKSSKSWIDSKLNILIPMAGHGNRFKDAGFTFPKPLIEIMNKPMIQVVLECINIEANYIFIIQKAHQEKHNIKSLLNALRPGCTIIETSKVTQGAACTALLAKNFINNQNPLIIANSDQYVEWESGEVMYDFTNRKLDGGILVFEAYHPKWSYAKLNEKTNLVEEVAEKKIISKYATVGIYYWKKGSDFVECAKNMIRKNIRVNGEFYICPVYNEAIKKNKKISISKVEKMCGLGTPEDLNAFLQMNK
jgi:beta-phosphoglucomutase-like phosphatase (HAD superfamily)/dTDP-glucose pyrophosphorylase